MDRRKKIITNPYEEATHKALKDVTDKYGARILPKVRIADVLDIGSSGLSRQQYGYALRAHFDFVIADQDTFPLFAVEFDGPHHEIDHITSVRDKLKRSVCDSLGLPMLRVDADYLQHRVGRFSLLGWLTELWFMEEAYYAAQMEGSVPFDEPFFYSNSIGFGYMYDGHFVEIDHLEPEKQVESLIKHKGEMIVHRPYDPFIAYRAFIANSYEKGNCLRPIPEQVTGTDKQGHELALTVLSVTRDRAVVGRACIRSFMFSPVSPRELAGELSVVDVAKKLRLYTKGEYRGLSNSEVAAWKAQITAEWNIRRSE